MHINHTHISIIMLWFTFILGFNSTFLCFKLIVIHYNIQEERKIKFKLQIKLIHNTYMQVFIAVSYNKQ